MTMTKQRKHAVSRLPKWAQILINRQQETINAQRTDLAKLRAVQRQVEERERQATFWTTSSGVRTRIVDLSTDHLRSIVQGLFGSDAQRTNVLRELKRRATL